MSTVPAFDRFLMRVFPGWAASRMRSRAIAATLARHYEAAQGGRRSDNWHRSNADPNAAAYAAIPILRAHARDLVRNNAWAKRGVEIIGNHTVGWGIQPTPIGAAKGVADLWKKWADTTECDADRRLTFAGLQRLAMRSVAEAGEVLIRRRWRRPEDGLAIPMQLQVLEPDFLDTTKDGIPGQQGGPIIQGIEFDALGRRVAYWLYARHPGSTGIALNGQMPALGNLYSNRVPAENILHIYDVLRPGQVRGVSWLGAGIANLKDFDEFEDAELMRQKIAACFAVFVRDEGDGGGVGASDTGNPLVETLEPGMIQRLAPGQDISSANPPVVSESGFSTRTLRRIAAALGVTYEDMTGDYSQVNFSSARMARISHYENVRHWRWNMIIPQMCAGVWDWAMEVAALAGMIGSRPAALWTPPPMPMIEPDKEGLAISRLVRIGARTWSESVREQGYDPETQIAEMKSDASKLDAAGLILDCDPRKTTQAGQAQVEPGASPTKPAVNGANGLSKPAQAASSASA